MVPGSTFRYGSNFIMLTRKPRLSSRQPIEAAASPLPRLDTTPPVTKTYFADIDATSCLNCLDWACLVGKIRYVRVTCPMKVEIPCQSNHEVASMSAKYVFVTGGVV